MPASLMAHSEDPAGELRAKIGDISKVDILDRKSTRLNSSHRT